MNTYSSLRKLTLLLAALLLIALPGCNKDDDEVATPQYKVSDFVGSWIATSLVQTSQADPARQLDMVAIGGEIRFTILSGGGTRTWIEMGAFSDEWDALIRVNGNKVTSTPEEAARGVRVYEIEYDGTTLKMTNKNDTFDFSLTGDSFEPTISVGTFVRH